MCYEKHATLFLNRMCGSALLVSHFNVFCFMSQFTTHQTHFYLMCMPRNYFSSDVGRISKNLVVKRAIDSFIRDLYSCYRSIPILRQISHGIWRTRKKEPIRVFEYSPSNLKNLSQFIYHMMHCEIVCEHLSKFLFSSGSMKYLTKNILKL